MYLRGVSQYKNKALVNYEKENKSIVSLFVNGKETIIKEFEVPQDGWGYVEIVNGKEKLVTFEEKKKDNSNSLIDNRINAIMIDSEGDVWYATSNGISCYDRSAGKWISYLSAFVRNSKNDNHIFTSLCEYKPGVILAGGYMSGIYRIKKSDGDVN